MKVLSFAISDRISSFISVQNNFHELCLQCFQKNNKIRIVCDGLGKTLAVIIFSIHAHIGSTLLF